MQLAPFVLGLALLLGAPLAAAASPTPAGPTIAPPLSTCAEQRQSLTTLGRPTANALLVGSQSATQSTQPVSDVIVVRPGDTISRLAAQHNTTVAAIVAANGLRNANLIFPGQRLHIPGLAPAVVTQVPAPFVNIWTEGDGVQGEALVVWAQVAPGTAVSGEMGRQAVTSFQSHCDLLWGLVAFNALDDPDTYTLVLRATTSANRTVETSVPIVVRGGNYGTESLNLPPSTSTLLDPELRRAENERLDTLFANLPPAPPRWQGPFQVPIASRITSLFGTRRSYNGGPADRFHEGIDYRGRVGDPIYAAAAGTVVLAEGLTVRGNTVFLDHGAGVVSGYFHMSEIAVQPGQTVARGDLLGKVGGTGLVTGPHLHWELRVNGWWVNPGPWLTRTIP